jgi:hypothetical protein
MPHSFLSHLASFCEPDGSELFSRDVITFYMGGKFDLWARTFGADDRPGCQIASVHRYVLETPKLDDVTEEVRAVVESTFRSSSSLRLISTRKTASD